MTVSAKDSSDNGTNNTADLPNEKACQMLGAQSKWGEDNKENMGKEDANFSDNTSLLLTLTHF